jgi:dTDP-4-dehydrorhamnose reductase
MKKILLLGANGQLGSDIVKVFSDSESTSLLPLYRKNLDVEETSSIKSKLDKYSDIDYIINCTSYHKTDECEDFVEKSFKVNSIAVLEMAKYCLEKDIVFVHISTDYVFGEDGGNKVPYKEDDRPNPLNVYGNSKLVGEFFVRNYCKKYFILRVSSLFGVAGSSGKGGNFIETMIKFAKEKRPLKVIANQLMSPTHTLDVAKAIKTVIDNNIIDYGTYHVCNSGYCSWYEFAKTIFEFSLIKADLSKTTYEEYKTKAKRPKYSVMDNAKICKYYRMPGWKEALKEYLELKGYIK